MDKIKMSEGHSYRIKKYLIALVTVCLFGILGMEAVFAAEGSVTYGSGSYSASQGENFQVGVYVNGSEAIGAYEFYLDYDADMLEYVSGADAGGGGRLKFVGYGNATSYSYMLTFKAKTAGSSNISITNAGLYPLNPASGDTMSITAASSVPVSIQGPNTASGECRLASLTVSPTGLWGFSPDVTEYDMTVDNSITKLSISATTKSDKATFVISDTNLSVGVNYITIKVTAENGTVKTYQIIARRKEADVAQEPTTPPLELPPEELRISFFVNGKDMYVLGSIDEITAPEGFEKGTIPYQGQEIPAFTGTAQGISLFYLVDGIGSSGGFYVYDAEHNRVYPYIQLKNPSGSYMLLTADDELETPPGYTKTSVALSSGDSESVQTSVTAWIQDNNTEFFLVYALNDKGEAGFYQYDKKEKTLQRYIPRESNEKTPSSPASEETGNDEKINQLQEELIALKLSSQENIKNKLLIITILSAFCVMLIITLIGMVLKLRGQNTDLDEENEEEEQEEQTARGQAAAAKEPEPEKDLKKESKVPAETTEITLLDLDEDEDFTFFDYDEEDE